MWSCNGILLLILPAQVLQPSKQSLPAASQASGEGRILGSLTVQGRRL